LCSLTHLHLGAAPLAPTYTTPTYAKLLTVGTGNAFTTPIAGGLKVGFVSSEVSVFVAALETVANTSVLANPKILALNKQRGEVLVGREDGYLTTTVTDTTTVQTVEFLKTGTRLTFRPYIGDDGYIRLEVHPEDSDGHVVNGLPTQPTAQVPRNVIVEDCHPIVMSRPVGGRGHADR